MYLIVYVDDIVLAGPNSHILEDFNKHLVAKFALRDLGMISYFMGLEVIPCKHGLFLNQKRYILDLLERTGLTHAKPVSTPMVVDSNLTLHSGDLTLW